MIGDVLTLLKNRLNSHLLSLSLPGAEGAGEEKVVFPDGEQRGDAVSFRAGAVTVLLYRIEQEVLARQGDPYLRLGASGVAQRVMPDVDLNLHLLFVARFRDYAQGLHTLSEVIRFFQGHRTFNHQNAPELTAGIAELAIDLVSLSVQQQNEVWGLLRSGYLPSVAYRVRTLSFRDDLGVPAIELVGDVQRRGLS